MAEVVKFSESGNMLIARLTGEIDHHSAKTEREEIDAMLFRRKPKRLLLDFSDVRFMDSSGIALIIGRADVAESLGCCVHVGGLTSSLKKLVRLSGIGKLQNVTLD